MTLRLTVPGGAATVLLVAGLGVACLGMIRGTTTISSYYELKKSREILLRTVSALQGENNRLSAEIERIRTSPNYAKKVLRDKYHLTEPDEDIVFFAD